MLGNNGRHRRDKRLEDYPIRKLYLSLRRIVNIRSLVKGSDDYKQRPKRQ